MNLLVVGVSHRTAPVEMLERLTVPGDDIHRVLESLTAQQYVDEAVLLSTCNRIEIYAAVSAFHGGLADIGALLAERSGVPVNDLAQYLYVHYEVDAVRHAFRVTSGLDSMVVGESHIIGQLRDAYNTAIEQGAVGRLLHELMQQALRVGKRAHAETEIDRAGQSVVTAALAYGQQATEPVAGRPALVIGAGSMGALAVATLKRSGASPVLVTNRSLPRARRLAELHAAEAVPFDDLAATLRRVDVVVTATASMEPVLDLALLGGAVANRTGPLLVLDLAMPRDVAPEARDLPGVTLVDLERLSVASNATLDSEARAAQEIVESEIEAFVAWLRGADVAPTVAALRARADEVVGVELRRLAQRCPELSDEHRAEVAHTLHRVVQRLLHQPTVRVRQLAAEPGGETYAEALRELFDLHIPTEIDAGAAGEVRP
jgi:glutamyl-tRNA reductase